MEIEQNWADSKLISISFVDNKWVESFLFTHFILKDIKIKMVKLKLEFEGWHCLPKKETKIILDIARTRFINANFIDNNGLLVETEDELGVFSFCLETITKYINILGSWDGYTVRKISKRIIFNYQDKKRKLNFEYFKKLITESRFEDVVIVLAGKLFLTPDETKMMLKSIERDLGKFLVEMKDDQLKIAYNLLIKFASTSVRKFV
jgi:hypothetical protein